MLSKYRLEHLKKARLISVKHFKKQKSSPISPFFNIKQPYINDAQFDIYDINNTQDNMEDKITWF